MTVPVLKTDFHNFGRYYFYKLKKLRACLVIQTIAALLFYPLAAAGFNMAFEADRVWREMLDKYSYSPEVEDEAFRAARQAMESRLEAMQAALVIGAAVVIAALVVTVIMHFIVPLISYRRLYRKTYADMDFSLPISADTGFWGDFLAGATVTVLPHLISVLLGLICIQPLHALEGDDYYSFVTEITFELIVPLAWTGFLGLIMLYCLTVLLIGCCGKASHVAAVPIIVNASVPAVHWLLLWLGNNFAAGHWGVFENEAQVNSLFVTSPLGMVIGSVTQAYLVREYKSYNVPIPEGYHLPIQQAQYLIPAIIVILLFILAAWLVIRRRRAEQTGAAAFASKPAQYAVHGLASLAVCSVAGWRIARNIVDWFASMHGLPENINYIDGYSVLLLIAVPVVYIILELAAGERKRFGRSMIRCAVTTVCSAGIVAAAMTCNAFGTYLRAPSANSIVSARVDLDRSSTDEYISFSVSERDNIEAVAKLQNTIDKELTYSNIFMMAERTRKDPESYRSSTRAGFVYFTANGQRKECDIEISEDTYREILENTVFPEVMANRCLYFHDNADEIIGTLPQYRSGDFTPLEKGGLTPDMVREAVKKDCENVTFERMYKCESGNFLRTVYFRIKTKQDRAYDNVLYVDNDYAGSVTVYPWFDNTLALLSEYGVDVDFGLDADKYKTAFIVKSLPDDGKEYYRGCYSGMNISIPDLFGLAGNENYIGYAEKRGIYKAYDDVTGERIAVTGSAVIDEVRKEYPYMRAVELDISRALELYPLCGSVYDVDTDYSSDHYILVFVNSTGEDLEADMNREDESFFIPPEYFDRVSGLFDGS